MFKEKKDKKIYMSQISIEDLKSILNLITVCNKRSAFVVSELEIVGNLYNKISLFIEETEKLSKKEKNKKEMEEYKTLISEDNLSSDENGGHSVIY